MTRVALVNQVLPSLTFQVLQLFRFGPSGLLGLRVVVVRLPCVGLVLLPGAFRKQLLQFGEKSEKIKLQAVTLS